MFCAVEVAAFARADGTLAGLRFAMDERRYDREQGELAEMRAARRMDEITD
jgi:hypothetical protein